MEQYFSFGQGYAAPHSGAGFPDNVQHHFEHTPVPYAAVNIIASPDEHFYIDEWGREMEAKLLKQ